MTELVLLGLAAYRLQRIVTADDWPPSVWFRGALARRFGAEHWVPKLAICHWCLGTWIAAGGVIVYGASAPSVEWGVWGTGLRAFAVSAIVGLIGDYNRD